MGFITNELVMLAEREPNSAKSYEYKLLMASKETKLHKKIDEAIAQGYAPITMIIMGDHIVVMEREGTASPKGSAAAADSSPPAR
jgi:hypothetical protein